MRLRPSVVLAALVVATACTGAPVDSTDASLDAATTNPSAAAGSQEPLNQDPGDPLAELGVSDLIVRASLAPTEEHSGVGQNHTMTVLEVRFSSPLLDAESLTRYLEQDPLRLTTVGRSCPGRNPRCAR